MVEKIENRKLKNRKLLSAQSMFEVILALAVMAIILTGIISLTSRNLSVSSYSKNKSQANRYASEAIVYARTQKEILGWSNFKTSITSGSGKWCMPQLAFTSNVPTETDCIAVISSTIFIRFLEVLNVSDDSMDIEVKVKWTDESGTHVTHSVSALSDW